MKLTMNESGAVEEGNLVRVLGDEYERLHDASCELIRLTPTEKLYWHPVQTESAATTSYLLPNYSCGESVLRSAGSIEQLFGGITANLWDDPFEWTLPETLRTPEAVINYLAETAATRQRGFALIAGDADLRKRIATPSGEIKMIGSLLMSTLVGAAHHLGGASATFRLFSSARLPRF